MKFVFQRREIQKPVPESTSYSSNDSISNKNWLHPCPVQMFSWKQTETSKVSNKLLSCIFLSGVIHKLHGQDKVCWT